MTLYRKEPVVIEAVQCTEDDATEIAEFTRGSGRYTLYTSWNELVFEDTDSMEQFLEYLARNIIYKYGKDVIIERVSIEPDDIFSKNYIFTILVRKETKWRTEFK